MKEQIQALAKECGLCDEDGDFYGAKNSAYERFAELVWAEAYQAGFDQGREEGFDDGYDQAQASAEYNSRLDD